MAAVCVIIAVLGCCVIKGAVSNTGISGLFYDCPKLETVNGVEGFDTRDVVHQNEDKLVNGQSREEVFTGAEAGNTKAVKPSAGDVITFGNYEQDNIRQNGAEPIEWYVLDVQENKALLLSLYALDSQPYNRSYGPSTWEKCTLRNWLNSTFLETAFTAEEKASILMTEVDNSRLQNNDKWNVKGSNNTEDMIFLLISSFDTSSVEESMGIFSGSLQLSELKVGPEFDISILREEADIIPYMTEGGTINGYPWESFLKQ